MRLRMGGATLLLSMFLLAPVGHAATINFTLSGGDSANITITESAGTITNITGTFDGSTILALLPVDSIGGNDNVYTGTSPYFDNSGVSFSLVTPDPSGFSYINLSDATDLPTYAFGTCQGTSPTTPGGSCISGPVGDSIALVAAPEPSSLISLGIGLVVLVGAAKFRRFA